MYMHKYIICVFLRSHLRLKQYKKLLKKVVFVALIQTGLKKKYK